MARRAFPARLLAWYDRGHRDLPWRRTSDPWAIWVSEIMLQQTRVEAVRDHYERFMQRYPTPADFADVDEDELLAAWRGLGYYRRARLLRAGAQAVMEHHGGTVPSEPEVLLDLPGIGAYTGGAVASIAFGRVVPAIDGNVERVIARHRGIREDVKKGPGARAVRAAATANFANGQAGASRPGDLNQAIMELGATVCTPTSPKCKDCPVTSDCIARADGLVDELPVLPKRRAAIAVDSHAVLIPRENGKILATRIPDGAINAGQLDLPGSGPLTSCDPGDLPGILREQFDATIAIEGEAAAIRHTITHHRIRLVAHWASVRGRIKPPLTIADPNDPAVPWTTLARKVFARVGVLTDETSPGSGP